MPEMAGCPLFIGTSGYSYAEWELKEWAETINNRMAKDARAGAVYFNNHARGQAPKNALRLISILAQLEKDRL